MKSTETARQSLFLIEPEKRGDEHAFRELGLNPRAGQAGNPPSRCREVRRGILVPPVISDKGRRLPEFNPAIYLK